MICKAKTSKLNYIEIPISGVIEKFIAKKRITLNISNEQRQLKELISNPPKTHESFRMISAGGFSSIAFIKYIADIENIENLYVSTLTVGKKQLKMLDFLYSQGKLSNVYFIFCSIFKQSNTKQYDYFGEFERVCKKNKWVYSQINNHSKLILLETENNYYVLETSSNLNENPKIEQFTFENDKKLFEFYRVFFEAVGDMSD